MADAAGLRPSADRVRETLFNWLQPVLPGARVLDLFAGSGALGLEALSRGAREAFLVERDPKLAESLQATVARLKGAGRGEGGPCRCAGLPARAAARAFRYRLRRSALRAAICGKRAVDALAPWLATQAWLYLESPAEAAIEPGPGWSPHREGRTREVRYALYRRVAGGTDTLGPVIDGPPATLA